jgi:hypothetical protein
MCTLSSSFHQNALSLSSNALPLLMILSKVFNVHSQLLILKVTPRMMTFEGLAWKCSSTTPKLSSTCHKSLFSVTCFPWLLTPKRIALSSNETLKIPQLKDLLNELKISILKINLQDFYTFSEGTSTISKLHWLKLVKFLVILEVTLRFLCFI